MRNKLLSLILALCVILSAAPTFAAFNDIAGLKSEYDIRVLEGLEIVDSGESYRPESYITRGDFFLMTARIMGYKAEAPEDAVSYLASAGVISGYGNGEFKCDSAITYNEALKMLVVALGYGQNAMMQGGWPTGYVTVASSLDVTEPADKISGDGYVTRGMAATLLVRAGNTKTAQVTYRDENSIMGPTGGETLFKESLGVTRVTGIINANSATSLDNPSGISLNEVKIGTDHIDAGNTNAKEYLGYLVDAYCVEEVGYKALAVVPVKEKNNVLRLSSGSDITATGSYPSQIDISFYNNDGKEKHVKAENCDVIYNGAAYLGFSLSDISIDSGEVILLDNDNDGIYDVIFINEYENYVVKNINKDTLKVYDVYGRVLDLDVDSEQVQRIGANGVLTDVDGIYADDILSVQKSKNGNVIKVQIVKKPVSGTIEAISNANGNTKLTIGGKDYYVEKAFDAIVHSDKTDYYVGLEAVFHLDAEGKIVHITTGASSGWKYGYIVTANIGDEDGKIYFKLFTEANKFERFEVVERVNVDGASKKVTALTSADSAWMSRQLIRYQAEGNILKKIDTTAQGTNETDDSLSVIPSLSGTYNTNSKLFYNVNQTVFGGTDNTLVFTIPTSSQYFNDDIYYTSGKITTFSNESSYSNLDAFNVNDAGIAKVIVRNANDTLGVGSTTNFVLVESVSVAVDAEGEVVQVLKGIRQNGNAYEGTTNSADVIPDGIKTGDFVRIREKSGQLVSVQNDFDFDTDYPDIFAYTNGGNSGTYYASINIACGFMTYADDTHIVIGDSNNIQNITFSLGSAPILLCDIQEETVKKITVSELASYTKDINSASKVCVVMRNGSVLTVVVRLV